MCVGGSVVVKLIRSKALKMGDQLDPNEAKYIPQNNEGLTSFEGYNNVGYQYNEPLPPPPPPADMHHGAPPDMTFGT